MKKGNFEIDRYMGGIKSAVDRAIVDGLDQVREKIPGKLYESMVYSLTAGGKRLRPILLISTFSIFDEDWERAIPYGAAVEYIHTYSLIHDDLPSMDDDDFRRGIPTCHKVYGEAMAILAGDALLTEAFRLMLQDRVDGIHKERKLMAAFEVASAAGAGGMVGGQVLDLLYSSRGATEEEIHKIHEKKTAALIRASVLAGGILSGANDDSLGILSVFGSKLGLAFQIVDDILDVTSSFAEMGKRTGKDVKAGKPTYPSAVGVQKAGAKAEKLINEARESISVYGERAIPLDGIARICLKRKS